ncbi:PucR family transcriptional regulator [Sporolactobacillus sp. THM7-4]|nr:PucR family transcriptional regulator [Sporolactobacillus sp. THM7-4]
MKVADLFTIPSFKDFKLIAGRQGMDNEIQNVNMMDAPDIIDFLKPNDWLVTSGYHLRNDPLFFTELVRQMADLGCAALGIKTRRYMDRIPGEVIEMADRKSLPLIEIPNSIALVEIVNQTLSQILDIRTRELRFAIDTHQKFTEHIMSGEGVAKLLDSLTAMIHRKVTLLDPYLKPMTAPPDSADMEAVADQIKGIGNDFLHTKSIYTCFSMIKDQVTLSVFPVYTYKKKRCFLLIWGYVPFSDRLLILTIEQAANVLAFELMKEEALKQSTRKIRNDFFANLVSNGFSTETEAVSRAEEFGLANNRKYFCVAGELDRSGSAESFTQYQMETDDVYECLEGEISQLPFPAFLFLKGNVCVMLVEASDSWGNIRDMIEPCLKGIQKNISRLFPHTVSFGVSNICQRVTDISTVYKEAIDALRTGRRMGHPGFIQIYQANDIMDILRMVPVDDLQKLYEEAFRQLADPTHEENRVLLHTLYVYLETNCQISETAKRLYVHRNTVIYRIDKCEKMLGEDLKDPTTTFRLRFAFRLRPILDEWPGQEQQLNEKGSGREKHAHWSS